jgi:hypothetical protein
MPTKRSFSQLSQSQGSRKTYRQKYSKRRYKAKSLTAKINKLARDLKPEVKYIVSVNNAGSGSKDSFGMWNTSTTSGFYTQTYPMNAIPEGDDQGARTGRKIRLLSGTMKGMLFQESPTSGAMHVKIYVFYLEEVSDERLGNQSLREQSIL